MVKTKEEIRNKIADHAIKWADERLLEMAKDERPPKRESNVAHRVNQANALTAIRVLVAELHDLERDNHG